MGVGKGRLISGMHMVGTKKNLGQHWLKNREVLEKIADLAAGNSGASEIAENRGDLCIEIGPGLGTLTSSLLKRFDKVIAVEYDERLARNLPNSFPGKNLEVLNEDILDADFTRMTNGKKYVIAGNIPYYITSPIISKILEADHKPERAVLLMQKEVAERVLNVRGNTPLGLLVENCAEVEAGPIVKAAEFEPAPKVDSQVIVMNMRKISLWRGEGFELGMLLSIAFEMPRKKILNNLQLVMGREKAKEVLKKAGVSPDLRPGDLGLPEYQAIWDEMDYTDALAGLPTVLGL